MRSLFRKNTTHKNPAHALAIKHYMRQINKTWRFSYSAMLLSGLANIFVFLVPTYVLAKLVSRVAENPQVSLGDLSGYIGAIAAAWMAGELIMRGAFRLEAIACARGIQTLYENTLEALLAKDISFFSNNFAGSLTKHVGAYARNYERFFDTIAFEIAPSVIPIIFASVVLAFYSPLLPVILISMLAAGWFIVTPFIRERRRLVVIREYASTHLTGHVADTIGNIDAVRSFAHEQTELKTHAANVKDFVQKARRSWDYQTNAVDMIISPLYVLLNVIGLIAVIVIGQRSGTITTEAILVTFGYFGTTTRTLFRFNQIYRNMETSIAEAGQFTEYLLREPAVIDAPQAKQLVVHKGAIDFNNVTFSYADSTDQIVFNDLSLTINPGESVGLVGHSGSGKTTITKLIPRFLDISHGSIAIDGQDISQVTQHSLRRAISTVPQEPIMFHRSIADNIAYGKPDATRGEIEAAAHVAHAHEFITQLPHGYDTMVGERGIKLSGGQRQRIAIARAMIKNAPILILDEATSALDSESEALIQDALWKLMKDRTAIVIAHRLSTIQKMDRIIVMEDGIIVEEGSHAALLRQKGTYAKLWAHQSGGFMDD